MAVVTLYFGNLRQRSLHVTIPKMVIVSKGSHKYISNGENDSPYLLLPLCHYPFGRWHAYKLRYSHKGLIGLRSERKKFQCVWTKVFQESHKSLMCVFAKQNRLKIKVQRFYAQLFFFFICLYPYPPLFDFQNFLEISWLRL